MKIGIVADSIFPRLGGMEIATYNLAIAFSKLNGISASVAINTRPVQSIPFDYPFSFYPTKSLSYLTPLLRKRNIRKMIRKEKCDLLHGQMLHGGGALALEMAQKTGLPVLVSSRGADIQSVPEIGYGARLDPDMDGLIRRVLAGADKVLAVSTMNKKMILETGVPEEKVVVVSNGVLYEEIGVLPFEEKRASHNLSPDDFLLVTVGRNRPIKRMELLLKAMSLIKDSEPDLKCVCVGPEVNLLELIRAYGLENHFYLTGRIPKKFESLEDITLPFPDLINWYRASNLFVSISYFEAFQGAALDALACGVPVLLGKNNGVRDVITEGETGFTLFDETPEGLADLLVTIKGQKMKLTERRGDIRQSVSHLSWMNIAERLREIYSSLL